MFCKEISRKFIRELPCWGHVGVLFNKLAGINSKPATLGKESPHQVGLPVIDKTEACVLQVCIFKRRRATILFFSKIKEFFSFYFFKTASFVTFSKENVTSSLYSKFTVWTLQASEFTKRNSIIEFFLRNVQIFSISYFP